MIPGMDTAARTPAPETTIGRHETVPRPSRIDLAAASVVLTVFALTWPILDLLGENAEFFLAHGSSRIEILAVAVVLLLVIPSLLAGLTMFPGRIGHAVAMVLVGLLAVAMAHIYLKRIEMGWWIALLASIAIGVAAVWAFARFAPPRRFARYLAVSPLVFLLVFLFSTPSGAVVREAGPPAGSAATVANPVPLVMIVFDEFPIASLIDPDGSLYADRYPNFARLAADGTWFRNAVTVEQQTEHSVPAILTGVVPDQSLSPFAGQYPNSLFTALDGPYDVHGYEAITRLCPIATCGGDFTPSAPLVEDVGIVAGHVLLPEPLTEELPPIDGTWGDFAATTENFDPIAGFRDALASGRRSPIDTFLDDIRGHDGDRHPFFFLHTLIPHHPWQYLPDGRDYPFIVSANPASFRGGWIDDDFLVAQGMQRHLLQVGYADFVLGETIAALEDAGLYEEAMVVVVADHGISIKPGVPHQRTITPTTVGEIAAIPLFIKGPNVTAGVIDDRRALTSDIVPTIADAIGAELAWESDGSSLLGALPERVETTTVGPKGSVTFGVDGLEKLEVAARVAAWFPGGDPYALIPDGAPDILGDQVDSAALPVSGITGKLAMANLYRKVDLTSSSVPARIGGILSSDPDQPVVLAIVVNGSVGAVTRSYVYKDEVRFLAMVPPTLMVNGANQIEMVEVSADGELLRIEG